MTTSRLFRITAALLISSAYALFSQTARGGGNDFPDNDAEAFGRGATFTAKADDPMAIEYNIAGLARMRGTHFIIGGDLIFHSYSFTRAGTYPQENQPYGGQPFPTISDKNSIMAIPVLGVTTDFNYFERWTFSVGIFAPHSNGGRDFGSTVTTGGQTWPSPGRYDLTSTALLIVFPTLAAAVRVTKWLDIGLAFHLVSSAFTIQNISFVPTSAQQCPTTESAACDAPIKSSVSGNTATGSLGIMIHPIRPFSIGINLRGPAYIVDKGTLTTPGPAALPLAISGPATFKTYLPWVLRGGVRWAFRKAGFEQGDVEVDADYEAWHAVEGNGDNLSAPNFGPFGTNVNAAILHHYRDTASIRAGGAYNAQLPAGVLTVRAGFWYESAATRPADTRLDFDTMAKLAPTVGLGYAIRGVTLNAAYGYVYEFTRNVTNGDLQSLNGLTGSNTANGVQLPIVNNGYYKANNQVFAFTLGIHWEELLKKAQKRVLTYDVEKD